MLVSKLVPLVVMGGIAAHSGPAIKDRISQATGVADKVVTRQRMGAIIEAATLHAASGETIDVSSPAKFRTFVKKAVRIKGNSKADASLDQWGGVLRCEMKGGTMILISSGPDKKFGSKDDIKVANDIYDY